MIKAHDLRLRKEGHVHKFCVLQPCKNLLRTTVAHSMINCTLNSTLLDESVVEGIELLFKSR